MLTYGWRERDIHAKLLIWGNHTFLSSLSLHESSQSIPLRNAHRISSFFRSTKIKLTKNTFWWRISVLMIYVRTTSEMILSNNPFHWSETIHEENRKSASMKSFPLRTRGIFSCDERRGGEDRARTSRTRGRWFVAKSMFLSLRDNWRRISFIQIPIAIAENELSPFLFYSSWIVWWRHLRELKVWQQNSVIAFCRKCWWMWTSEKERVRSIHT